ncbi:hypothetical protein STCU_07090 [Strigomonas culicis]|uniref:Timeless N-terminal domain-containing protein n=1 Tax=Strigomonas culicis TaxID=28005 RepID=S9U6W2_9TRYP|nr:hypothetical protein STCU_07090 [Strigomonas culicis]|eukprot:EPY24618.1 hypothetical protein STCU_07090 [Strigomonas culicis]
MSSAIVKKQLLMAVGSLNVPLDHVPSKAKIEELCNAAKLIRNRLLREHGRVTQIVESLRQEEVGEENSGDDEMDETEENGMAPVIADNNTSRDEFVFISDLKVAEKLVIPLLFAHGMRFSDFLLPQLLKLLIALLQPVPRFSSNEPLQHDHLLRIKARCGNDELFAFLVQCAAPIAEKRSVGAVRREDVILLEIILTVIARLLDGPAHEIESIIGAFCRNHGIELLLVIVNQNYSKVQAQNAAQENTAATLDTATDPTRDEDDVKREAKPEEEAHICLTGSDGEDDDVHVDIQANTANGNNPIFIEENMYEKKMQDLIESDVQIWKWNVLVISSISAVLQSVSASELAFIAFQSQYANPNSPEALLTVLQHAQHLRDCKKEAENWRYIAKSKQGAFHSNGLLVRTDGNHPGSTTIGSRSVGTVSALYGTRRKDPLELIKDMDMRKRGRFVKGMFEDNTSRCNLPFPTKILLSQQSQSFLCFGFEPLSTMVWSRLQASINDVVSATKEYQEAAAGSRKTGEVLEITSPIDADMYASLSHVLHYMNMCGSLLRYIRETAQLMKEDGVPLSVASFQQQWQSISSVITLDHLDYGFSILRCFLKCRDLRKRLDVKNVVTYLAEILLVLNLLLDGEIINDPSVEVAAHALASSILYKEDNIKVVFDLLSEYSQRHVAITRAQAITLFTFAAFQLMEKCSYKGSLLLPKRPKRAKPAAAGEAEDDDADDDQESINSAQLEAMNEEILESIQDMIDDSELTPRRQRRAAAEDDAVVAATAEDRTTASDGDELLLTVEDGASRPRPSRSRSRSREASEAPARSEASRSSGGHTALSSISSEREVSVDSYLLRLASPRNAALLHATLKQWRLNDADVNHGLTFLMDRLVRGGCGTIFFNIDYLLVMRDILVYGRKSHEPLYAICDNIVFQFFNPPFAVAREAREAPLRSEQEQHFLSGAQSCVGFEVALRCTRALFHIATSDYAILEERGQLTDRTSLALPGDDDDDGGAPAASEDGASAAAPRDAADEATTEAEAAALLDDVLGREAEDAGEARAERRRRKREKKERRAQRKRSRHRGDESDGDEEAEAIAAYARRHAERTEAEATAAERPFGAELDVNQIDEIVEFAEKIDRKKLRRAHRKKAKKHHREDKDRKRKKEKKHKKRKHRKDPSEGEEEAIEPFSVSATPPAVIMTEDA